MKRFRSFYIFLLGLFPVFGCELKTSSLNQRSESGFSSFENRFLDSYWKQYPGGAIAQGYGKYYEHLVIPDSASFASNVAFSTSWIDSLGKMGIKSLNPNEKISFNIIKNQLESDIWYTTVFKQQEWDPTIYNISGACDYILNQPYAPLDKRLKILSQYISHADLYYKAGLKNLNRPTREHVELATKQNRGGLDIFGKALGDSISVSHLSALQKDSLRNHIALAKSAIQDFSNKLDKILLDKTYTFRDFRIGNKLFTEKFKYDLATDLSPQEIYQKAKKDNRLYHQKMFDLANKVWTQYYPHQSKPADSIELIQKVLDKIQLHHASPKGFYASIKTQVDELKKFVVERKLFAFDTLSAPIVVRYMPVYERGIASASAEFIPPYQEKGTTYFNIDDINLYPPQKAESVLKEDNTYASQILSIHEAMPGHCLQGIYNNKKSSDVLRSVFTNGAMIEGWAVYCEGMMLENGWGNHSPEIELSQAVWKIRELANVIIDYDIQVLHKPKEEIVQFLNHKCFQSTAQVEEKYHRATVSQVQLCSYYTGFSAIQSLRDDYQKKMGSKYNLKDFHEKFLSYGSAPVKYIRERMLE